MVQSIDDRVPVRFGAADIAMPEEALLIEGNAPVPAGRLVALFQLVPSLFGHPIGCACCTPRGPVAEALGRLFLARARGDGAFFRSVVAVVATSGGRTAVQAALAQDQVCAGRFRLAEH
jgi:hypothetical protein